MDKDAERYEAAKKAFQRAFNLLEGVPADSLEEMDPAVLRALIEFNLAGIHYNEKQFDQAETAYVASLRRIEKIPHDRLPRDFRDVFNLAYLGLATVYSETGRPELAEQTYVKSLARFEEVVRVHPLITEYQNTLAGNYSILGLHYQKTRQLEKSAAAVEKAIRILETLVEAHSEVPKYESNLVTAYLGASELYFATRQAEKAEQALTRASNVLRRLTGKYPNEAKYQAELAFVYFKRASLHQTLLRPAEAEADFDRFIKVQKPLSEAHPENASYAVHLAGGYCDCASLIRNTRPQEALQKYDRALAPLDAVLLKEPRHELARTFRYNTCLGRSRTWSSLGKVVEAVADMEQVVALAEEQVHDASRDAERLKDLASDRCALARLYLKAGQTAKAEVAWKKAIDGLEEKHRQSPETPGLRGVLADACAELALAHDGNLKGKSPATVTLFKRALELQEKQVEQSSKDLGARNDLGGTCCNLGNHLKRQGKNEDAVPYYDRAIATLKGVLAEPAIRAETKATAQLYLRNSYTGRAISLTRLKNPSKAISDWQDALALQEQLARADPKDAEAQSTVVYYLTNLASLHRQAGRIDEAVEAYRKAAVRLKRLGEAHPAEIGYQRDLSSCYETISDILATSERQAEACTALQERILVLEKLRRTEPKELSHPVAMTSSLVLVGLMSESLDEQARATASYQKALDVWESMASNFGADKIRAQRTLPILCHSRLGILRYQAGKLPEAEKELRQAIELRKELLADKPSTEVLILHGGDLCNLGHVVVARKQPKEALGWYGQAIDTLKGVLDKEPRQDEARQYLRNAHLGRSSAYRELKRYREAAVDLGRVVELFQGTPPPSIRQSFAMALARNDDHVGAVREAKVLLGEKDLDGATLYNLACTFAVAAGPSSRDAALTPPERERLARSHADQAMDLLSRARAAGYFKPAAKADLLKRDTDLDVLRARDDFKKLLEEVQKERVKPKMSWWHW
jgi:tetratricopeptide (TPR) repeat protein